MGFVYFLHIKNLVPCSNLHFGNTIIAKTMLQFCLNVFKQMYKMAVIDQFKLLYVINCVRN